MDKPRRRDFARLDDGGGATPEGCLDDTPHGRSIRERNQVLKPVEVDEAYNILDGRDRWDVATRLMRGWPKSRRG